MHCKNDPTKYRGGEDMTILCFLFGAFCGALVASVAMAMLFVAKRADEIEFVAPNFSPSEAPVQGLCTADR